MEKMLIYWIFCYSNDGATVLTAELVIPIFKKNELASNFSIFAMDLTEIPYH